jgi:hypothetical protein
MTHRHSPTPASLALLVTAAAGFATAGEPRQVVAFAARVETRPVVDGRLDEPVWAQAPEAGPFLCIYDNSRTAEPRTGFRVVFDRGNVYFGIRAVETEPFPAPPATPPPRDQWPSGASLEIFLDVTHDRSDFIQLAAGLAAGEFDQRQTDVGWNGSWTVARTPTDGGWTMEFAIPFADLGGAAPEPGSVWGLNVCRNRPGGLQGSSTWAPVGGNFHNPGRFGLLIFGSVQDWWQRTRIVLGQESHRLRQALAALPAATDLNGRLAAADQLLAAAPETVPPAAAAGSGFLGFYGQADAWARRYREIADELEVLTALVPARQRQAGPPR